MASNRLRFSELLSLLSIVLAASAWGQTDPNSDPLARFEVTQTHEQVELIQNTSRRIRFEYNIPEFVVEDPQVVQAQPVAPNELVLRGLKPGFSSVTVADPNRRLTTLDIHVVPDIRMLEAALGQAFPDANLRPVAMQTGVMLTGHVARATDIPAVMNFTRNYYPDTVINRLEVGGSQMIAMQVKVYQVSRTKLRRLGIDWSVAGQNFNFVSSVSEVVRAAAAEPGFVPGAAGQNLTFGVFSDDASVAVFMQALERNDIAKLMDEPTLVAMNGRAAEFLNGGEIPIQVASGLGTNSIEFRPFGTKLDLVPIVLGQGRLRLEIRAEVSEVAPDLSSGTNVPGFRVRRVNTGAEMNAGYTLVLAGDYREESTATKQGVPGILNRPYLGQLFRKNEDKNNEIELVFLITPTFISEFEQNQLPGNLPGRNSGTPSDCEFYIRGYQEVPRCETDCPLPTPVGAINNPNNVLPPQPYVPESMPKDPNAAPAGSEPPAPPAGAPAAEQGTLPVIKETQSGKNSTTRTAGFTSRFLFPTKR